MAAQLIDGKQIAKEIRMGLSKEVEMLRLENMHPGLAVILVGDNPASESYVKAKAKACAEAGIYSEVLRKPSSINQEELLDLIQSLNRQNNIHGILVQLPLPDHISEQAVIEAINPEKDVDGFHPINVGNMLIGAPCYLPCTPHGVVGYRSG